MSNQPALFVLPAENRFNGNNWFTWHGTIWSTAGACGVQGYLEGTIQKPSPLKPGMTATATSYWGSKNPSPEEWEQHNMYTKSLVDLNVKNPIGHGIQPTDTAAEAWAALKDIHSIPSDMGLLNADNTLRMIKHIDGTDILTHFAWMHEGWVKVNAQGGKMDDPTFRTIVLHLCLKNGMSLLAHSFPSKPPKNLLLASHYMTRHLCTTENLAHKLPRH